MNHWFFGCFCVAVAAMIGVAFSVPAKAETAACNLLAQLATESGSTAESFLRVIEHLTQRQALTPEMFDAILKWERPENPFSIFDMNVSSQEKAAFGKAVDLVLRNGTEEWNWPEIKSKIAALAERSSKGSERRSEAYKKTANYFVAVEKPNLPWFSIPIPDDYFRAKKDDAFYGFFSNRYFNKDQPPYLINFASGGRKEIEARHVGFLETSDGSVIAGYREGPYLKTYDFNKKKSVSKPVNLENVFFPAEADGGGTLDPDVDVQLFQKPDGDILAAVLNGSRGSKGFALIDVSRKKVISVRRTRSIIHIQEGPSGNIYAVGLKVRGWGEPNADSLFLHDLTNDKTILNERYGPGVDRQAMKFYVDETNGSPRLALIFRTANLYSPDAPLVRLNSPETMMWHNVKGLPEILYSLDAKNPRRMHFFFPGETQARYFEFPGNHEIESDITGFKKRNGHRLLFLYTKKVADIQSISIVDLDEDVQSIGLDVSRLGLRFLQQAYETSDGRIEAIFRTQDGLKHVQLYGPK